MYFLLNVGWIMFGKIRLADISFRGLGTIFCCSAKKLSSHLKWVLQGKDEVAAVAKSGIFWLIWRLYEDFPYHDLSVEQSTHVETINPSRDHIRKYKSATKLHVVSDSDCPCLKFKKCVFFKRDSKVLNIKFKSEIVWKVVLSWLHWETD